MLEEIRSRRNRRIVFRLSRITEHDDQFLSALDIGDEDLKELLTWLVDRISTKSIDTLIDEPFRPMTRMRNLTRFSDGSFPVFYSSLETETAEAEVAYWYRKAFVGAPRKNRTAYYQGFHCTFEGLEKDLRPKAEDWPELLHDNDYSFCNHLGEEARESGIDELIVPAVRHRGGQMFRYSLDRRSPAHN